jgi:Trk K+ transport system NAD-binding subunit
VADDKRVLAEEIQIPFCKGILLSNLEIDLFGCITLGVKKTGGGFKFNPKGDFSLEYGDTLIVIGKPRRIEGVRLKILRESMNG